MSFNGHVAAISGAGSGIGRALAQALAAQGCELALSDIDAKGLAETCKSITNVKVVPTQLDVSQRRDVVAWAERARRAFGRCTMIFNNAGVAYGAEALDGDPEEIERVMNVNFWGVVYGCQAFVPLIEAAGGGHVVNISSLFGLIGFPGNAFYCASKFAVRGFTETLRLELDLVGSPVSVTCVHPGGIKTAIARNSRIHESVRKIGVSPETGPAQMEQHFRTTPEEAAATILRGVRRKQARVLIGADAKLLDGMQRLMPGSYSKVLGPQVKKRANR